MKKIVYTCLAGDIDQLEDPIVVADAEYICYSDVPRTSKIWNIRPLVREFTDPRLSARYHKTIVGNTLEADEILWQDSKIRFHRSANALFDLMAQHTNADVCFYTHPVRNCIYAEALRIIELDKAPGYLVKRQVAHYQEESYPNGAGLYDTCVYLRRNTQGTRDMAKAWWEEIERFTVRDQLSLPYVMRKLGTKCQKIGVLNEDLFYIKVHTFAVREITLL